MNEVITALIDILTPLVTSGRLKYVGQTNDAAAPAQLRGVTYPQVLIHSLGEDGNPGPFGGSSSRNFHVRLRLWDQWPDPLYALSNSNTDNLFVLTDEIRRLLNTDKALSIVTPEYQYYKRIADRVIDLPFPVPTGNNGQAIARDIMVDYWRLESWTGPINPQLELTSPAY